MSLPMLPEQYTMPLYLMAWERPGGGVGALVVLTASRDMAMVFKDAVLDRWWRRI